MTVRSTVGGWWCCWIPTFPMRVCFLDLVTPSSSKHAATYHYKARVTASCRLLLLAPCLLCCTVLDEEESSPNPTVNITVSVSVSGSISTNRSPHFKFMPDSPVVLLRYPQATNHQPATGHHHHNHHHPVQPVPLFLYY